MLIHLLDYSNILKQTPALLAVTAIYFHFPRQKSEEFLFLYFSQVMLEFSAYFIAIHIIIIWIVIVVLGVFS